MVLLPVPGPWGAGQVGSAQLHVVLLNELHEVERVGELQAEGVAVEGGGSLLQHLLIVVLAELGHQLQQQNIGIRGRLGAAA